MWHHTSDYSNCVEPTKYCYLTLRICEKIPIENALNDLRVCLGVRRGREGKDLREKGEGKGLGRENSSPKPFKPLP